MPHKIVKWLAIGFLLLGTTVCSAQTPVKIIFDTDFGDDGDDLAALAVLHHLVDIGEVDLLAVGQSNSRWDAPGAIDAINTYYGRPDIPIGKVTHKTHEGDQYSSFLVKNYPFDLDLNNVPSAVSVYRRALANAPDKSVKFVVVGFKSNMRDLLQSKPDDISPLSGVDLIKKKVILVSDMGGRYPSQDAKSSYNFKMVEGAAKYYVGNWPTPMIFAGVGTGGIKVGMRVRKTDTPVGRAMELKLAHGWKPGESYQAGFDLASVLVAARGADKYFNMKSGCNRVEANGANHFDYGRDCGHQHIDSKNRKVNYEKIGEMFEKMMLAGPKNPGSAKRNARPRTSNNFLLDAKISGNLSKFSKSLRGAPEDLLFDLNQRRFVKETVFHEYGVGFKEEIGVVSEDDPARWMAEWKKPIEVNQISLVGVFANQPQPETAWKIELRSDGKWRTHARGVGGWYDSSHYHWGGSTTEPIRFDAMRVSLFSKNDKSPLKSIHFRSRDDSVWNVTRVHPVSVRLRRPKNKNVPQVILDTDAKNEVDDQHFIGYGLFSNVELLGINSIHHGGGQEASNFAEIQHIIKLSLESGLANDRVPPVFHGADRRLEVPESGKWFDTQPVVTEASEAILEAARRATPENPVWILPVGPCTNIASAVLQAKRSNFDLSKRIRVCWLGGGPKHAHLETFNGGNDPWSVYVTAQSGVDFWVLLENPTGASLTIERKNGAALYPDNPLGKYLVQITPVFNSAKRKSKSLYDLTTISMVIDQHLGRGWLTEVESAKLLGPKEDYTWKRVKNESNVKIVRNIDEAAMKKDFFDTLNGKPTPLDSLPKAASAPKRASHSISAIETTSSNRIPLTQLTSLKTKTRPVSSNQKRKIPVIFDSDIGDDIDDAWALCMLLKSPRLDVKLVIGDQGKTEYRTKQFAKFLEIAKRTDIPIGVGLAKGESGSGPVGAWVADYDLKSYPGTIHQDGVQAIIDTIMNSPEPVTVIAVGPMPNLLEALKRQPKIAEKAKFVGMYGHVRLGKQGVSRAGWYKEIRAEHNVVINVKASQAVFSAPWDIKISPVDTCAMVSLTGKKFAAVRDSKDPLAKALIENYYTWSRDCTWFKEKYRRLTTQQSTTLFDTAAVYLAFSDELLGMETLPIRVTDEGKTVIDSKGKSMSVATEWKDLEKFEDLLVKLLTSE